MTFYLEILNKLLKKNIMSISDSILVVAGGEKDRDVFLQSGFSDVVISNLDYHKGVSVYHPYEWLNLDLEDLDIDDQMYDWVVVHAGLHHCASPHRGLCEMLRVSKKGVVVVESRDSLFNGLTNKLGLTTVYEIEPCVMSGGQRGGWRNTHIPNFVYKWTENEVKKTTNSFLPQYTHKFHFFYGLKIPTARLSISKNPLKRAVALFGKIVLPIFIMLFRRQGNLFGFAIEKNKVLQPWLKVEDGILKFDMEYGRLKYNPEKYIKN